jgi:hypothetical protein
MSSLELLKRLHGEFLRLPGQEDLSRPEEWIRQRIFVAQPKSQP